MLVGLAVCPELHNGLTVSARKQRARANPPALVASGKQFCGTGGLQATMPVSNVGSHAVTIARGRD